MAPADTTLDLPPDLRLPDLSNVQAVTAEDLLEWRAVAEQALRWGPDQRNGCTRGSDQYGNLTWHDGRGDRHSPDAWTPAEAVNGGALAWMRHGLRHRDHDQPAWIDARRGLAWHRAGPLHRAHAPAAIQARERPRVWAWDGSTHTMMQSPALVNLLQTAWLDRTVNDRTAHHLLDAAAAYQPRTPLPIDPARWVAHVLAANERLNLTSAMRAWLRLLLC